MIEDKDFEKYDEEFIDSLAVEPKKKRKKPILTEAEIIKRNKRKTKAVISAFVLVAAVGVAGNWYYQNTDISSTFEPLISASSTKTLGEAELVDATTTAPKESEYFASARVDRQKVRDEALDKLQRVVDSAEADEQSKKAASEEIARISGLITIENKIETLVCAKGIDNCIAVVDIDGSRVDVIIDSQELNETIALQVKEIAVTQLNCSFEDVSIIQAK